MMGLIFDEPPFMAAAELTVMAACLHGCSVFHSLVNWPMNWPCRGILGNSLAETLMAAGEDLGVTPYGLEALNVMRIEKAIPPPLN